MNGGFVLLFFPQLFPGSCENVYPTVARRSGQDDSLQHLQISIRLLTKIGFLAQSPGLTLEGPALTFISEVGSPH